MQTMYLFDLMADVNILSLEGLNKYAGVSIDVT